MLVGVEQEMAQAKLARSEMDMFRDFFSQAQDSQLSEEQDQALSQIIKQLNQQ
jgi:exonuclease SbcD